MMRYDWQPGVRVLDVKSIKKSSGRLVEARFQNGL
jgi:hypothetical protein